ncbi:MAG: DUF262 domain-containing protein, partial [Sulfuriferula sp.]
MSSNKTTIEDSEELIIDEEKDDEEAFVVYDIASYPSDLTLSVIKDMWTNGDIVIPEFQRNFVWNIKQASLLIESFLLGLPVPQVFFYIENDNKSLIVDGQQRILSVCFFFEGYFKNESTKGQRQIFRLTGLDNRSPFAEKRYDDLDESSQRKLKSSVLRAINIRQLSPKGESTSVYHIFERLNTGGTPLKPQEIRNCVFRGELVNILRSLNKDKYWRKILGKQFEDTHQKDVELILRIFALSNSGWLRYEKPMKEFLNVAMDTHKNGNTSHTIKFVQNFPKIAELICENLGTKPFHIRGPLNSSALDSVYCVLLDHINQIPSDLQTRFSNLKKDKTFTESTYYGTSDVAVL